MKRSADYRRLPYRRRTEKVVEEEQVGFVAYIVEIPWIRAHADDPVAAGKLLDELFDDAIEAMVAAGDEIPEPPGTLEAFGAPEEDEPSRWSSRLPPLRARAHPEMLGVTFDEEHDVELWESPEVQGERLIPRELVDA